MRSRVAILMLGGALLSCNDVTGPLPAPELTPRSELIDGRNGGAANFFFLPPIAPATSFSGTFDPDRSPVVEVCPVSESGQCAAVIARYTTQTGTSSERLRVDLTNELYIVQWQTMQHDLSVGTTYRIRVLDGASELGHADARLLKKASEAKTLPAGVIGVVMGVALPIKFRIERSTIGPPVTASVGAEGGRIDVILGNGSQLTLLIPLGALSGPLTITVTPKPPAGGSFGSVGIEPGDILFLKPVTLTFAVGSPLAAGDVKFASLAVGAPGALSTLFLPTTPGANGQSFTATTVILGSPQPVVSPAQILSPFSSRLSMAATVETDEDTQVDLVLALTEQKIAAFRAAADELDALLSFEAAIKYRLAAASLLQIVGDDDAAAQEIELGRQSACTRLEINNALAPTRLGAEFRNLWPALRPVLAWNAAAQQIGLTAEGCAEAGRLAEILDALVTEFIELYTSAMEGPAFPQNADGLSNELYDALVARKYGQPTFLGMQAEFQVIKTRIQLPLAERYRKAAYAWCRSDNDQNYLGRLFQAARDQVMYPIGLPPVSNLAEVILAEDDFGFDDSDLSDDIHRCGTVIVVRSVDTDGFKTVYGPVGGGAEPGTATSEITIQARPHGTIELDSLLVAFQCEDEQIGNDRIFVDFNGTRIRELLRIGVTPHFIRVDPRVFKVDSLASLGGVNLEEGGTFPLTILRESNGCGGDYLRTGEGSTKVLATINVEYPKIRVEIAPTSASLQTGDSRQFTATVTGTGQTAVTWTVTGGTSSIAGNTLTYTAGSTLGSFSVKARSVADTARVATATVVIDGSCPAVSAVQATSGLRASVSATVVDECSPVAVTLTPDSATVAPAGTQQFTATVTGASNTAVTWSATGGTISSAGLYTAGQTTGVYQVAAVSVADTTKSASATLTISGIVVIVNNTLNVYACASILIGTGTCDQKTATPADSNGFSATARKEATSAGQGSSLAETTQTTEFIRGPSGSVTTISSTTRAVGSYIADNSGVSGLSSTAISNVNGGFLEFEVRGADVSFTFTGACELTTSVPSSNSGSGTFQIWGPTGSPMSRRGCFGNESETFTDTETLRPGWYRLIFQLVRGSRRLNGDPLEGNATGTMSFTLRFGP